MAVVNWGFLHYMDMKKSNENLKNLFFSWWTSDCLILAVIATGKLPSLFLSPPGKVKFLVRFSQFEHEEIPKKCSLTVLVRV